MKAEVHAGAAAFWPETQAAAVSRDPLDKQQFLNTMRSERRRWEAEFSGVSEERLCQPGAAGEWSVKDVIAHITWHEREMIGALQARALIDFV